VLRARIERAVNGDDFVSPLGAPAVVVRFSRRVRVTAFVSAHPRDREIGAPSPPGRAHLNRAELDRFS